MLRPFASLILLLTLTAGASAQVSVTIPVSPGGMNGSGEVVSGFRDIPPGPNLYQVTIQSSTGFLFATLSSSSYITWYNDDTTNSPTQTFYTVDPYTEAEIGTVSGTCYLGDYLQDPSLLVMCSTVNAWFDDVFVPDDPQMPYTGTYYDAEFDVSRSDYTASVPDPILSDDLGGETLPNFSIDGFDSGEIWFTAPSTSVGVYRLDSGTGLWTKWDQPFFVTSSDLTTILQQGLRLRVASPAGTEEIVRLHVRSTNTANPTADGDTIDILKVYPEDDANATGAL